MNGTKMTQVIPIGNRHMPAVGLGLWKISKQDTADTVYDAIALGYRHLDSAADYGNEIEVGQGISRALAEGICSREELWVTSKLWNTSHRREHVEQACRKTLSDLALDYLDLYQLHWPERQTNNFGIRGYKFSPSEDIWTDNFEEILITLNDLIKEGKIRSIGLSNENPWGIMRFLNLAKKGLPKIITVQNPYNLLNRLFEVGTAELCMRERVGLLAYSPLAFGRLTGKYRKGQMPEKSRFKLFPNLARFSGENSINATDEYYEIANTFGLSLTEMAVSFVNSKEFVTSNIIGATNLNQLSENINSINKSLSTEILTSIDKVHTKYPDPAP